MKLVVCLSVLIACSGASAFQAAPGGLLLSRTYRGGSQASGVCGLRAQQQPSIAMPELSTIGKAAQELGRSLQYAAAKPLRARYCAAQVARFSFFLSQSTAVNLWGGNPNRGSRLQLEIGVIVGALTDAILSEEKSNFDLNVPIKDKPMLVPEEQRQLFNKNFQAIIDLMKLELRNVEDGKYALPYDLELSYAPQWSPLPVLGKINQFLSEREVVVERSANKRGMEIRDNFRTSKSMYPRYYLQNFHYQTDGWLSDRSAQIYDYQVATFHSPRVINPSRHQPGRPLQTLIPQLHATCNHKPQTPCAPLIVNFPMNNTRPGGEHLHGHGRCHAAPGHPVVRLVPQQHQGKRHARGGHQGPRRRDRHR